MGLWYLMFHRDFFSGTVWSLFFFKEESQFLFVERTTPL